MGNPRGLRMHQAVSTPRPPENAGNGPPVHETATGAFRFTDDVTRGISCYSGHIGL